MSADLSAYFEEVEARFENAHDLDLGLEEEFQVLDPDTLALTGAFKELRDSAPPRLRARRPGPRPRGPGSSRPRGGRCPGR